jgi:hypothetical protein
MRKAVGAVFFRPIAVVELVAESTDRIPEFRSVGGIAQRVELFHVRASFLKIPPPPLSSVRAGGAC